MEAFYRDFQHWLMVVGLTLIPVLTLAWLFSATWRDAKDGVATAWRKATQGKLHRQVVCALFVVVATYLGATKPSGSKVSYDGGIKAGTAENVITNDTVIVTWQRDLSGGIYVPESATVYIDYRERSETNGVWTLLAETYVGAWSWSGTVQNATNYDYNVWAYYIPPTPVHTNGVWTYKTMRDRAEGRYALPLRSRVEVNGKAIATPKEVRRDEEDD